MRSRGRITPVILAGGAGKRLWPLSSADLPKQFRALIGGHTLLQATALRTAGRPAFGKPLVIAHVDHRFVVGEQLRAVGLDESRIVLEPVARNTAPAAAVAALLALRDDPHAILLLLPTDHAIGDADALLAAVEGAAERARDGAFVLFGITPDRPATGYGYIEAGEPIGGGALRNVVRFVEKPPQALAEQLASDGRHFWNSGIFLLPARGLLDEIERHAPEVLSSARRALDLAAPDHDFLRLDPQAFEASRSISIDHAILEKTDRALLLPVDMNWTDIGTWVGHWDLVPKDQSGNVTLGSVLTEKTSDSYLRSEGPLVAAIGLKDIIVVATSNAILVASKAHDQDVKLIVDRLEEETRRRS